MSNAITKPYSHNGHTINIQFTADAFFNATAAAKPFSKSPKDWLKTEETREYIFAIRRKILVEENQLVKVVNGAPSNGGGTWIHPKLGVHFARWLNADFAVWADEQIALILSGELPQATLASQPRMYFAATRIARNLELARSVGGRAAMYDQLRAAHQQLGLPPILSLEMFGKPADQMQLEGVR
jgi:hypothetical protein